MAFQRGQKRPDGSGRQKGTPNKKTLAKVSDFLVERDINPAEEILKIINEKKLSTNEKGNVQEEFALSASARADLWIELLSFCHAKPKTLEVTKGNNEDDFDPEEFSSVPSEALMKVLKTPSRGTA